MTSSMPKFMPVDPLRCTACGSADVHLVTAIDDADSSGGRIIYACAACEHEWVAKWWIVAPMLVAKRQHQPLRKNKITGASFYIRPFVKGS